MWTRDLHLFSGGFALGWALLMLATWLAGPESIHGSYGWMLGMVLVSWGVFVVTRR